MDSKDMFAEQTQSRKLTIEEYLKSEEKSEVRHEFYHGRMYAMAGGTINHNRLIRRVADLLKGQPSLKQCGIFCASVKVCVQVGECMSYPDVTLTRYRFDSYGSDMVVWQPQLIVEVHSKLTANYDGIDLMPEDDEIPVDEKPE